MLRELWRILWGGCEHKWETNTQVTVVDIEGREVGQRFYLRCENCGNVKCKELP